MSFSGALIHHAYQYLAAPCRASPCDAVAGLIVHQFDRPISGGVPQGAVHNACCVPDGQGGHTK